MARQLESTLPQSGVLPVGSSALQGGRDVGSRVRAIVESRFFVPSVLLAALLLRVVCVVAFQVTPTSDFSYYYARAVDLLSGKFMVLHGAPTAYWPVGYVFFLAGVFFVTGPSVLAATLANVAIALASLGLVHWITLRLTGSRLAAGVALAVMAFHPNHIAYCALTSNEVLGSFMILAGVALLLRTLPLPAGRARLAHLALCGVVFGFGCLVKPQIVVLPTILLAWLAWRERQPWARLAGAAFLVNLALGATIMPWLVHEYRAFGRFVFVATSGGGDLYLGNNPLANGGYPPPAVEHELDSMLEADGIGESAMELRAKHAALAYIASHPLRTLELIPAKLWYLYAKDVDGFSWIDESSQWTYPHLVMWLFRIVAELYWVGLMALFAGVLYRAAWKRPGSRSTNALPLVVLGTVTAIYLFFYGMSRFHFPIVPWIAIYVGGSVAAYLSARASRPPAAMAPDRALTR